MKNAYVCFYQNILRAFSDFQNNKKKFKNYVVFCIDEKFRGTKIWGSPRKFEKKFMRRCQKKFARPWIKLTKALPLNAPCFKILSTNFRGLWQLRHPFFFSSIRPWSSLNNFLINIQFSRYLISYSFKPTHNRTAFLELKTS